MIPRIFFLLLMLFGCAAHAAPEPALVRQLAAEESDDKIAAIQKLALSAEPEALALLQQLADCAAEVGKMYLSARFPLELGNHFGRQRPPGPGTDEYLPGVGGKLHLIGGAAGDDGGQQRSSLGQIDSRLLLLRPARADV